MREPGFTTPYIFSRTPRFGVQTLPKRWKSGECLIYVSCINDHDVDVFRFADVAHQALKVIEACVDVQEPRLPWGGVEALGTVGSFYVSLGGPIQIVSGNLSDVGVGMVDKAVFD